MKLRRTQENMYFNIGMNDEENINLTRKHQLYFYIVLYSYYFNSNKVYNELMVKLPTNIIKSEHFNGVNIEISG